MVDYSFYRTGMLVWMGISTAISYLICIVPYQIKFWNAHKALPDLPKNSAHKLVFMTHTSAVFIGCLVQSVVFYQVTALSLKFFKNGIPKGLRECIKGCSIALKNGMMPPLNMHFQMFWKTMAMSTKIMMILGVIFCVVGFFYATYFIFCKTEEVLFSFLHQEMHWDEKNIRLDDVKKSIKRGNRYVVGYYFLIAAMVVTVLFLGASYYVSPVLF